ncbi:MAG: hypothetical protein ACLUUF_02935 [Bifidobacterium pullorum]
MVATHQTPSCATPQRPHSCCSQTLLTAAVIVCDWIASNTRYFPLNTSSQNETTFDADARAARAWKEIGIPAPWRAPHAPADIRIVRCHIPRRCPHRVRPTVRRTFPDSGCDAAPRATRRRGGGRYHGGTRSDDSRGEYGRRKNRGRIAGRGAPCGSLPSRRRVLRAADPSHGECDVHAFHRLDRPAAGR